MNPLDGRAGIVAITRHGATQAASLARLLPDAEVVTTEKFASAFADVPNPVHLYSGALSAQIAPLFEAYDQIVFLVSLGAVVRLIAPHLKSKDEDPGVLVVDDAGDFVIPVLSGHVGGANAWAEYVAGLIGATPVLTTASDVGKTIPVDILGRELGWQVEAPKINITRVSAHVVNGEPIAFVDERDHPSMDWWTRTTPLPGNIHLLNRFEDAAKEQFSAVLWVTNRHVSEEQWAQWLERLVVYRPSRDSEMTSDLRVVLGLGCDRGTSAATIEKAVCHALAQAGVELWQVVAAASIDLKSNETGLLSVCKSHDWPLSFYSAGTLAEVKVPNPSEMVLRHVGTPSVGEAAAILRAGGTMDDLLVEKYKYKGMDGRHATVSVVRINDE